MSVNLSRSSMDWFAEISPKLKQDDIKTFKDKGMEIYVLPPNEREKWAKATASRWDKELSGLGTFGARIRAIADASNQKYPYMGN